MMTAPHASSLMAGSSAEGAITFRREAIAGDEKAVREIVSSTGYFSADEIEVAVELIADRISRGDQSDYRFIFAERRGQVVGYVCYGPIACTIGSFDLYWIAVHAHEQSSGIGRALMSETEQLIRAEHGRRIYVETSSREQYAPTREFYRRCGYTIAATLEDFYAPGDSKVMYVKSV